MSWRFDLSPSVCSQVDRMTTRVHLRNQDMFSGSVNQERRQRMLHHIPLAHCLPEGSALGVGMSTTAPLSEVSPTVPLIVSLTSSSGLVSKATSSTS